MWKRNKQQRIEFFNSEPSICDIHPIIETKDLKLNWIKEAKKDFQDHVAKGDTDTPGYIHLTRCPGIFDLFKYGYVIPLSKDIMITPKGEDFHYNFHLSQNPQYVSPFGIQGQNAELIARPPWSANFLIKIITGWHVIAPKGVKFLVLPIAYPDTFNFTNTIGIMNPALSTEINLQLFWNTTDETKETVVRAGTPLAQLIPLSEKKYQMVQRTMNQQDSDWVVKVNSAYESTFHHHTIRGKIASMYNKYWKR